MKILIAVLALALSAAGQSFDRNIITLIPSVTPSTGAPLAPGITIYRDLSLPANTVSVSAPNTVTASYPLLWPATLTTGCLNVSNATTGQLTIATCGGAGLPVPDSTIITQNVTDATKQMRFDDSIITTGNTRVLQVQDANYTLAGTNITNTFSLNQYFGADVILTGGGGSAGSIDFDNVLPAIGAIKLSIPLTGASIYQFTLPPNGGTNHYVLYTDGAGTTNWASIPSLIAAPFIISTGAGSATAIEGLVTGSGSTAVYGSTSGGSGYGGYFVASGSGDIGLFAGVSGSATTAAEFSGNVLFNNGSTTGMEYVYTTKTLQFFDASGNGNVISYNTGSGTYAQLTGKGFATSGTLSLTAMSGTSCLEEVSGVVTATGIPCSASPGSWTSYTPSTTNLTGVTTDAAYYCYGKTCHVRIGVAGSAVSTGTIAVSLPTTPVDTNQAPSCYVITSGTYALQPCVISGSTLVNEGSWAPSVAHTWIFSMVYETT